MSYLILRELSLFIVNKKYNSNDGLVILEKVTGACQQSLVFAVIAMCYNLTITH